MNERIDIWKWIAAALACLGGFLVWLFTYDAYDQYLYPMLWYGLFGILLASVYFIYWKDGPPIVNLSGMSYLSTLKDSSAGLIRYGLFPLRMIAIAFLVMAFARPQEKDVNQEYQQGIDIVMVLDLSSSMLARDLRPDRLEASKKVIVDFIANRPNDRFGLIAYAGNARTLSPLTTDHRRVMELTDRTSVDMLNPGTAIGLGLGYGVNRLRESTAVSKVIILLTDGENNIRQFPPLNYAESAKEYGVKVYTIGVGKKGLAEAPVDYVDGVYYYGMAPVTIDEETLKSIADVTGGKYFRATDNSKLAEIYAEIDQLERTEIESKVYIKFNEEFFPLALIAFILLLVDFTLRYTLFRSAT